MPRSYNHMPDDMRAVLDTIESAGPAGIMTRGICKELEDVDFYTVQGIVTRLRYDGWITRIHGVHPSVYRLNRPIPRRFRDG